MALNENLIFSFVIFYDESFTPESLARQVIQALFKSMVQTSKTDHFGCAQQKWCIEFATCYGPQIFRESAETTILSLT